MKVPAAAPAAAPAVSEPFEPPPAKVAVPNITFLNNSIGFVSHQTKDNASKAIEEAAGKSTAGKTED